MKYVFKYQEDLKNVWSLIKRCCKVKKIGSWWVGPGPFYIENWKSVSNIGFQQRKSWIGGWVGGFKLYPIFFWTYEFCLPLQGP